MQLIETSIGELYYSLTAEETKALELYLQKNTTGKNNVILRYHRLMRQAKEEEQLSQLDYTYLKAELFGDVHASTSKLTTYTSLLIAHIKDFLLLSKIRDKNIYTETLWGEILIERGLKRSLLLKISNFKFNLFRDDYALLKSFYHKRESFYYDYMTLTRKNYSLMIDKQLKQIESFKEYFRFFILELYYSAITFSKLANRPIDNIRMEFLEFEKYNNVSNNILTQINYLNVKLSLDNDDLTYKELKAILFNQHGKLSEQSYIQLVPNLLNFGTSQIGQGFEKYYNENFDVLNFLYKKGLLFKAGFFTIVRIINYISLELRFGSIARAEELLSESLRILSESQKESFQYLIESLIEFAKENYKIAVRKISIINPSDSIYYYPQYKIILIKCNIMLGDIDRLSAEQENFYKYILNNKKKITADAQQRHKLFIRYSEYLTEERFEYLSAHMYKRMEMAIQPDSPYFTEKLWVRERWEFLKDKFDK